MLQWSLAALGPWGAIAAVLITIVGAAVVVDETDFDPIWENDGNDASVDEDGMVVAPHEFRYWDEVMDYLVVPLEDLVIDYFDEYYQSYGKSAYCSLDDYLEHLPSGLTERHTEAFIVSLWEGSWGTWPEASEDDVVEGGGVTVVPDTGTGGTTVILPGINQGTVSGNDTIHDDATADSPGYSYRTDPTVQYVSDYVYNYEYVYRYTYPDPEPDFDWYETDGDFTVSYYQEDFFDWGLYFLIVFPTLAAEILIFNKFRHPKVVS